MTPEQFDEWRAAYNLDPWGDDWVQIARLEAAIINASGPSDPVQPADLVPTRENLLKGGDEVEDDQLASNWKTRLGF